MSKYSDSLYNIVKDLTYDIENKSIYERIDLALPILFDFDFPMWTESYRTTLERKIVSRYLQKEICCGVLDLWKFMLYERLNTIMPYYNELYKSTIKEYDFTKDHIDSVVESRVKTDTIATTGTDTLNGTIGTTGNDTVKDIVASTGTDTITETGVTNGTDTINNTVDFTGANKLITVANGTVNADNTTVDCDTPQARLNNGDYASKIQELKGLNTQVNNGENNTTATDKTINVGTNGKVLNTTNDVTNGKVLNTTTDVTNVKVLNTINSATNGKVLNTTNTSSDTFKHDTSGNNIPIADLILKYRDTIINIDSMIIDELYDLFMLIY